jgi:hypothetical protein
MSAAESNRASGAYRPKLTCGTKVEPNQWRRLTTPVGCWRRGRIMLEADVQRSGGPSLPRYSCRFS